MNSMSYAVVLAIGLPASLDFLRNGVFIAIIANGLIGISLVWDKVLLKQPETKNLVSFAIAEFANQNSSFRIAFLCVSVSPW